MKKILVAGATGYLGRYLIQELKKRGYWVRALVRNPAQAEEISKLVDDFFIGQVTDPNTLRGVTKGVDTVFSSIGITRQKDNLTYNDVDYQGNMNLLEEAIKSGTNSFLYVSVFDAQHLSDLKIVQAKERFAKALIFADIDHCIIRPTGFFSDMKEFLTMAEKGRVMLFGNGELKGNPISGADLAIVCCDAIENGKRDVDVGGPKIYTQNEMATAAFNALGKKVKISYIPTWLIPVMLIPIKLFTSSKFYGPIEFLMKMLSRSWVADCYGNDLLEEFYCREAANKV